MSHAGTYIRNAKAILSHFEEGKPHSSITDWIEVLSSDRYEELSLDGIPELVESVNIQAYQGTTEASRAIRKKLKYGNVHRQLRALVILRALTENAGKGFQLGWANQQLMDRLKEMANDSLLDPKVKRRMILTFHAWSIQYKDEPRMQEVARLYAKYGGAGPGVKKPTTMGHAKTPSTSTSSAPTSSAARKGTFDDDIFSHDWAPAKGQRGPDTYTDLAAAKADAEQRKREREQRILMEQREAEVERRERELKRKQDMAALEARRQKEAAEEAERRRKAKEDAKKRGSQPKRPPFDFQKEKPQIMISVANAIQCANNLVNSCRHIDRTVENVLENPKVQDNLDKAKAARRSVIRYIQVVTDEEYVGTLLEANEKIVEAIQLYDRASLSKPAVLDSDSEDEADAASARNHDDEVLARRLQAQKLEADRTGELDKLQEFQKRESARRQLRRQQSSQRSTPVKQPKQQVSAYSDLQDLDFGAPIGSSAQGGRLPPPMRPDSDDGSVDQGSLSDFSDYDSSDPEYQAYSRSRAASRRQSLAAPAGHRQAPPREYASLEDDYPQGRSGLLDPNDPFGDPFADENDTPIQEKKRMQCE
ncbi:hypothetical protein I317_07245 [Kwoniella heveanensis CBS 569]|uniref:VHS domain-containing protein n=1 Tax=Kwoniella heveanensis BCC8398 TaxID=1296120 RepID=A0A1B9H4L0_9TREE|nr:hypothetical protein I316_00430 [Kwoniella heveanensis BCC8398]OCF38951.1 hypothetical protein I317_07245 [Kwoniella heveanensis CBS 569]